MRELNESRNSVLRCDGSNPLGTNSVNISVLEVPVKIWSQAVNNPLFGGCPLGFIVAANQIEYYVRVSQAFGDLLLVSNVPFLQIDYA